MTRSRQARQAPPHLQPSKKLVFNKLECIRVADIDREPPSIGTLQTSPAVNGLFGEGRLLGVVIGHGQAVVRVPERQPVLNAVSKYI